MIAICQPPCSQFYQGCPFILILLLILSQKLNNLNNNLAFPHNHPKSSSKTLFTYLLKQIADETLKHILIQTFLYFTYILLFSSKRAQVQSVIVSCVTICPCTKMKQVSLPCKAQCLIALSLPVQLTIRICSQTNYCAILIHLTQHFASPLHSWLFSFVFFLLLFLGLVEVLQKQADLYFALHALAQFLVLISLTFDHCLEFK